MPLGREVDDLSPVGGAPVMQVPGAYLPGAARTLVVLEHCGIALLERECDTGTHHANAVDGVDQDVGGRLQEVTFDELNHGSDPNGMPGIVHH